MTAKYGIPYFSNYVNSDMKPSDIRSMCCGGFFGSVESTGSIGVVTINMPKIVYLSKDKKDFYALLIISISLTQSLYLKGIFLPPTIALSSGISSGIFQSKII